MGKHEEEEFEPSLDHQPYGQEVHVLDPVASEYEPS
jgi:hypothetical protein